MKAAPAAAVVVILVGLLTWFSLHAVNPEAEVYDQAFAEFNRFGMIENALYRHVFAARVGMLRNYDPLVADINALRDSLQQLRDTQAADANAVAAVDQLASTVDRQEELVEHFKTQNALLQNSLSFFGRFGGQSHKSELDPAISAAAAAILHLALDTSASIVRDVQDRLDDLEQQSRRVDAADSVEALLAHGQLLNHLLPSVDTTLKALQGLSQKQQQNLLRDAILTGQIASRSSARRYRAMLYVTSLLLVAFLVHLGLRLRSHTETLRRRAAFEHIITGISMRFINAAPSDLAAEIDRALADICAFIGPDRAYFVMTGPIPRVRVWHRDGMEFPPDWPARAPDLAALIGTSADGIVHVPRVDRMAPGEAKTICLDAGLGGWACTINVGDDGVTAALGFDAVGRPCRAAAGELPLLRMAFDSIVRAVERQTMERERTRLETRLQQAQRMEQIGFFTSGIAHNFNNILGGILGHSEVIEEHVGADPKLVRNLGAIRRSAERARDLVDQILVFGRRRAPNLRPLSIGALIAEAAALLEVSLPDNIELIIRQPSTAAIALGEHSKLQQVLLNLCRNAAHAMPDGGRIEIETELHELQQARMFSHDKAGAGNYVCIAVTDTGHGMDSATIERVFEPFFTTRQTGNGLGLATVRDIVREHGGALNVRSRPGEGSRFEIWLPRASSSMPTATQSPAGLPKGNGETVMLVAYNIECVMRDEEVLAALGYEPVGFSTVESARAACQADPTRFDLVVVGHFGSTAAAISLASDLHAVIPRVPIVLATKAAFEIAADTLVTAGIVDVVRWPLLADEVAVALAHSTMLGRNEATPVPRHDSAPTVLH